MSFDQVQPTLLARRTHDRFYDDWEAATPATRQDVIHKRLSEYIEWARLRPFYSSRLVGVDLKSPHPLAEVPVLTASELRAQLPPEAPEGKELCPPYHLQGYNVFQSGGTTGAPKTTLFSDSELEALAHPNARGFFASGLRAEDRVANLFAVGGLYMTFVHIHRMLQQYGCMNFPFSNHTPPDFIHTVARMFKINSIAGIASVALSAMREMKEIGLGDIKIEKLFYGGERIYPSDEEEVQNRFGTQVIRAPGYGTVDTWYIGYQCEDTELAVFHAHDDQCFIEIVDEEDGMRNCEPGETGMLFATPFPRRLTPVVRYRVGDLAQWTGERCRCGRTTPVFRLLGRGDDVLRIGYDSVDYNFIQETVAKFSRSRPEAKLTGTIRMEKSRVQGMDALTIRVEQVSSVEPSQKEEWEKLLAEEILKVRPSLREFVKKGIVLPIETQFVASGELPRNPRTGKLIRVVDSV